MKKINFIHPEIISEKDIKDGDNIYDIIYFLVLNQMVMYVGQSYGLSRIYDHRYKKYTDLFILPKDKTDKSEEDYIRLFKPPYNKIIKQGKGNDRNPGYDEKLANEEKDYKLWAKKIKQQITSVDILQIKKLCHEFISNY